MPSEAASSALVSRPGGSSVATDRIAAVRWGAATAGESRVGIEASAGSDQSSLLGMNELHVLQRSLGQAGEYAARADFNEPVGTERLQREHRLAPADRVRQRLREAGPHVVERLRGHGGQNRDPRRRQLDARERGLKRGYGSGHHRRMEGTADRKLHRPQPELLGAL